MNKKIPKGSLPFFCFFLCLIFSLIVLGDSAISQSQRAARKQAISERPSIQVVSRYEKSLRASLDGCRVLVLRGTHRERGKAHGFLMARDIVLCLNGMLPMLQQGSGGQDPKAVMALVNRFTWPKPYEEKLAGMLEGIREGLPKKEERMLFLLGREIELEDLKFFNSFPDFGGFGCSSFSAWGKLTPDGEVMVARNLDYNLGWASTLLPYCILADVPEEENLKPTLDISFVASVGALTIMNEEGVYGAMHDEDGLKLNGETFISRALGLRTAVEKARAAHAVEDMAAVLRKHPPIFGANIHVAAPLGKDPEKSTNLPAVLEWDGNEKDGGVTIRKIKSVESPYAIFCTNHFRKRTSRFGRHTRYTKLRQAAADFLAADKPIDAAAAKAMLDSVAPSGSGVSLYSVIMWPRKRKVAFALSPAPMTPATKGKWIEFGWNDIFALR